MTATEFPKMTVSNLKQFVKSARPLCLALIEARAWEETIKPQIDALNQTILDEMGGIAKDEKWGEESEIITKPDLLYLCDLESAEMASYHSACNTRARRAGLKPDSMDDLHCPSCVAQHETINAENALLRHFEKSFGLPEIYNMEIRKDALRLALESMALK